MIRKLLLPAAAVLLGGCMAGGYNYRSGPGDYYYGQPSVDYRHYGSPYGYYGYPGYYRHGYGGYYGTPYYPYYPRYYYRPHPNPRPDDGGNPPAPSTDNDTPPPWRNLDNLRRRGEDRAGARPNVRRAVPQAPRPRAVINRPNAESRMNRMEQVIRRARRSGESDERQPPR